MVHHTAESERATLEYGVVTPIFPETQIGATVVEILIDKKRQPRGVDLLMCVPRFTLKQPALAEIALVTQDRRIAIDPIFVERRRRLVRISSN